MQCCKTRLQQSHFPSPDGPVGFLPMSSHVLRAFHPPQAWPHCRAGASARVADVANEVVRPVLILHTAAASCWDGTCGGGDGGGGMKGACWTRVSNRGSVSWPGGPRAKQRQGTTTAEKNIITMYMNAAYEYHAALAQRYSRPVQPAHTASRTFRCGRWLRYS